MKACFTTMLKCKDGVLQEAILVALPLIVSQMLSCNLTKFFFLVGPLLLCQRFLFSWPVHMIIR